MSSRLPRIDPVSDALTRSSRPARSATIARISSAAFPNVALSNPPTAGPVRWASASVASPMAAARGMTPSPDTRNTASGGPWNNARPQETGRARSSQRRARHRSAPRCAAKMRCVPSRARSSSRSSPARSNVPCSAGRLDLDEALRLGDHHVRVHLSFLVLGVAEVESRLAGHDPDAHRGHESPERIRHAGRPGQPGARIRQRHRGARDRGRARPAVGLQHVAIDADRVLAEGESGRARRAGCGRSTAGSRACGPGPLTLARRALERGARQHGVFGGHPAQPGALAPSRDAGLDRRRAQHHRAAHPHEAGAFGVRIRSPLQRERAQGSRVTSVGVGAW